MQLYRTAQKLPLLLLLKVSVGKTWTEGEKVSRVPIIVTANDLSVLYAPLLRDGRMDKFYWEPQPSELAQVSACSMPIPMMTGGVAIDYSYSCTGSMTSIRRAGLDCIGFNLNPFIGFNLNPKP